MTLKKSATRFCLGPFLSWILLQATLCGLAQEILEVNPVTAYPLQQTQPICFAPARELGVNTYRVAVFSTSWEEPSYALKHQLGRITKCAPEPQ